MTDASSSLSELKNRLETIQSAMTNAAVHSGRDINQIMLLAVTKTHLLIALEQLLELGVREFGESRVQEFIEKYSPLGSRAHWHFIGHLQRNKVVQVVGKAAIIHSVDSVRLIEEIEKRAAAQAITQRVLIEVNIGRDPNKTSAAPEDLPGILEALSRAPHVRAEGLMTVPPYNEDPEASRPYFRDLRNLMLSLPSTDHFQPIHLSMGMSGDYEVAIEEGATIIRVGSALLGERAK